MQAPQQGISLGNCEMSGRSWGQAELLRAEEVQWGRGTLEPEQRKAMTPEKSAEGGSELGLVQKWMAEV